MAGTVTGKGTSEKRESLGWDDQTPKSNYSEVINGSEEQVGGDRGRGE